VSDIIAPEVDGGDTWPATADSEPLRIICNSELWLGANCYAFVRALRRGGHSVHVLPEGEFAAASWRNPVLRAMRWAATPLVIRDYTRAVHDLCASVRPHLLFIVKGRMVTAEAIEAAQAAGAVAINYWPDVSVKVHGSLIPRALPHYDLVFTTKSFGVADMAREAGVTRASFLPCAFDADTHHPMRLDRADFQRFGCDVSFIGTWSPKKEAMLATLRQRVGTDCIKVWGAQWDRVGPDFDKAILTNAYAVGSEYAKAISATRVNLAILSEMRPGSSSGDQTTTRTFEIPAAGGFMLHERTEEVRQYFLEDRECALFSDLDEMVEKIRFYLAHEDVRRRIAAAGRERCLKSGYSFDDRAATVVAKARELLARRGGAMPGFSGTSKRASEGPGAL
jgi:spore maturation protein CgeB